MTSNTSRAPLQQAVNVSSVQHAVLQRACACGQHTHGEAECAECRAKRAGSLQRAAVGPAQNVVPPIVHEVLRSPGRPLDAQTRSFMEPRFGHDFSRVRVHTDAKAAESARAVNALAYTVGRDMVFESGQYTPGTSAGRRLLAHELTHVVQQEGRGGLPTAIDPDQALEQEARATSDASADIAAVGNASPTRPSSLQRQPAAGTATPTRPNQRLEYRPSIAPPCACLVFMHNEERNARSAAGHLHNHCHYNLAIIGAGTSRTVPIRGAGGSIDPNELFPRSIQEECTRDELACASYESTHNDLRAMQIQFFLTIKRCSQNFTIPTVALHNNALNDTRSLLNGTTTSSRQGLRGDFLRTSGDPVTSRAELRRRLGPHRGIMDRSGTTNIFRWCNAPEISRCHVGDPDHPDHVIWVTTGADFNTLSAASVNVVLQEGAGTASGSESETDLSTLFVRLGPTARYINIETPGSPQTAPVQSSNLRFIENALANLGLTCCDPVGDFPTPASNERLA